GEALCRDEGILYAEIDLAQSVEPKQFHDVVGSYNRFDIFTLSVDRSARRPATFTDEARDPAGSRIHPACAPPGRHRGMRSNNQGPARTLGARAAQTDDPRRAERRRGRPTDPGDRDEHPWKSGLAAGSGRRFGDLDGRLCVLIAARLVALC